MTAERAQRVLAARRARITRIRKAVATASVVIFVALFSAIYVQMATGRDPVLAAQSTTESSGSTSTATSTATVPSTDSLDTGSVQSDSGSSGETDPGASLTPMTTSQS